MFVSHQQNQIRFTGTIELLFFILYIYLSSLMIQYKKHDFSQKHDFSFLKINYNIKQVTSVMKLKKTPKNQDVFGYQCSRPFYRKWCCWFSKYIQKVPGSKDGTYIPQVHVFALVCANSVKYQIPAFLMWHFSILQSFFSLNLSPKSRKLLSNILLQFALWRNINQHFFLYV